jgi:UDP-N-acetylglucosamine 2-epimerase (non-hydrolysing)
VRYVGNTMIDSLRRFEAGARQRAAWRQYVVDERDYILVTLHRPANVDAPAQLARIVDVLCALARETAILFPMHPRTRARLAGGAELERLGRAGVGCIDPVGYLDFLSLQAGAGAVVTDSGGVQEETSALGVPCYTLRSTTERPVTISHGTNVLLGEDPSTLLSVRPSRRPPTPCAIPLWDGHAAVRAACAVVESFPQVAEARSAASA